MSNIDKDTINKIAKLSNIKVDDQQKDELALQLTKITNWVEALNEVDTDDTKILNNVHNIDLELFADEVENTCEVEEVLVNSPASEYNYFTVPKVL